MDDNEKDSMAKILSNIKQRVEHIYIVEKDIYLIYGGSVTKPS